MKKTQRIVIYSVLAFIPLLFIPVVRLGGKLGWLSVWFAYRLIPHCLTSLDELDSTLLFCAGVITLHIGISVLIGIGLNRLTRNSHRGGSSK